MKKLFTFLFIFISFNIFVSQNTFASSLFVADLKESISIYPNPIATNATIKISNEINLQESNVNVVFYNIVEKEIFKISQIKNYEINISRDNFKTSGLYFYQLNIDEKLQSTGKVIVK